MASNVAVLVGSLRRESLNRKMAKALIELAPASLKLEIIEIGALPHYREDRLTMVCVHRDATLVEACRLMRACDTTELMVVAEADGHAQPIGKVSAGDIALRVVALELDPSVVTAGDLALVHQVYDGGGRSSGSTSLTR
jgi:hypothetical protein